MLLRFLRTLFHISSQTVFEMIKFGWQFKQKLKNYPDSNFLKSKWRRLVTLLASLTEMATNFLYKGFLEDSNTAWKVSKYGDFSGPYFPAFGLNTERYGVSLRIQSEYGKIWTRKTPYFDNFHTVKPPWNKNKVNSIETGRTVIVYLFPWSDRENCSTSHFSRYWW